MVKRDGVDVVRAGRRVVGELAEDDASADRIDIDAYEVHAATKLLGSGDESWEVLGESDGLLRPGVAVAHRDGSAVGAEHGSGVAREAVGCHVEEAADTVKDDRL